MLGDGGCFRRGNVNGGWRCGVSTEGLHDAVWRGVTIEGSHDAGWRLGVSVEAPHDGVNIVTTRCRLLCHDLNCGAEFFWRRFGLLSKFFDLLLSTVRAICCMLVVHDSVVNKVALWMFSYKCWLCFLVCYTSIDHTLQASLSLIVNELCSQINRLLNKVLLMPTCSVCIIYVFCSKVVKWFTWYQLTQCVLWSVCDS